MSTAAPEHIILSILQDTATPEQEKQLNGWLQEDPQHVELFCQIRRIWDSGRRLSPEEIEAGWIRIAQGIQVAPAADAGQIPAGPVPAGRISTGMGIANPASRTKRALAPKWTRYAAAVVLGALVGTGSWLALRAVDGAGRRNAFVQQTVFNQSGTQKVVLPDNSSVWLKDKCRMSFPDRFAGRQRLVALEGNAFFDVHKNETQPFIVQVGELNVKVTGTQFYIESQAGAEFYAESQDQLTVTLITGGVSLFCTGDGDKNVLAHLKPGEQAVFSPGNKNLRILSVNTDYYLAWKDGTYRFQDETLERIADQLSRHYGVDIHLAESLRYRRFTGQIRSGQDLQETMSIINASHPIRYSINKDKVYIR